MDIILPLTFLLLGLLIGSFLNVDIVRMEAEEGFLFGRSACRSCGSVIRWYDNIPILSFLMLRGRCRECRASISWQYPVIEGVTALLFFFCKQWHQQAGLFRTQLAIQPFAGGKERHTP